MLKKTTLFAAAIALSGTTAFAGGMADPVVPMDKMDKMMDKPMAAGSSVSPTYIVLGVLAALVIAAAAAE